MGFIGVGVRVRVRVRVRLRLRLRTCCGVSDTVRCCAIRVGGGVDGGAASVFAAAALRAW